MGDGTTAATGCVPAPLARPIDAKRIALDRRIEYKTCMDLLELIRQKKKQIGDLQKELDEALAELTGDHLPVPAASAAERYGSRRGRLRAAEASGNGGILPTSSMGLAVAELREAGRVLHVDEMIRRAEAKGHKIIKTTLVGNLSRYNKEKNTVYRAKPSFYGLLEWKNKKVSGGGS